MNTQTVELVTEYADKLKKTIQGTRIQPGNEAAVEAFVNDRLPAIIVAAQNVLADKQVNAFELMGFVQTVSSHVRDGLNIYNKADRGDLLVVVREIVQFAVQKLFVGESKAKTLLMDDEKVGAVIDFVYRFAVKFRR